MKIVYLISVVMTLNMTDVIIYLQLNMTYQYMIYEHLL